MAEFYVDKVATQGETHLVYNAASDQLPAMDTLFYIGSYASMEAAVTIAKGYYLYVDTCDNCAAP